MMPRYSRVKPLAAVQLEGEKRSRANFRERRRVSEMNGMFDVLLNLLPPSHFKMRLSRVQILREAADYIARLTKFLELPYVNPGEAQNVFPHIFIGDRQSNKDSYRRPIKLNEGAVQAYISRHELSQMTSPEPPIKIIPPSTKTTVSQQNLYIAYF